MFFNENNEFNEEEQPEKIEFTNKPGDDSADIDEILGLKAYWL